LISPETIALVRDRTDIVALITESVPSLKRRGRTFVGLCPFHKEKTPSFHVNPDRGFFHCFGCKEAGSAIDFLMKMEGATFPEAVRDLAERAGVEITEDFRERTEVDRQRKQKDDLYAVNQLAATYFEHELQQHPQRGYALEELARRGLVPTVHTNTETDGEVEDKPFSEVDDTLQAFRIGYAPPGWDGLTNFLKAQGVSPVAAEQVGLLVPRSSGSGYYDRFRHRLMFAVMDPQGRVVAFSGRSLDPLPEDKDREDKPAKYINSPESPIYTKGNMLFGLYQARHAIRAEETAVLVEGNFDVVSLHARGMKNVAAPLGTAFTLEQAKLLKRFAGTAILLFDGDAAGKKATRLSRAPLKEAGLSSKVANLPEGVDPDDLARTKGVDALREVVGRARGMLEFLIDEALDASFNSADAYERAARVGEVAKLLAEEDDPLIRSMAKSYADQLAGRLDLQRSSDAFRALEANVKKALASAGPRPERVDPNSDPKRARIAHKPAGSSEKGRIVGALIEYPELLPDADVAPLLSLLEGPSARTVAALAESSSGRGLDVDRFLAQVPPAIQAFARERVASPRHETIEEAKADLIEAAESLRRLVLTQETDDIAREQHKSEGDWDASISLGADAMERARARHGIRRS
jgi:DNA primase